MGKNSKKDNCATSQQLINALRSDDLATSNGALLWFKNHVKVVDAGIELSFAYQEAVRKSADSIAKLMREILDGLDDVRCPDSDWVFMVLYNVDLNDPGSVKAIVDHYAHKYGNKRKLRDAFLSAIASISAIDVGVAPQENGKLEVKSAESLTDLEGKKLLSSSEPSKAHLGIYWYYVRKDSDFDDESIDDLFEEAVEISANYILDALCDGFNSSRSSIGISYSDIYDLLHDADFHDERYAEMTFRRSLKNMPSGSLDAAQLSKAYCSIELSLRS
ncbi:hypothetical protein [Deinococcus yavapaiensis]|uniref:Uncharacterized protein n=1 Tax=Deinococcus yavapaiensis KR-236 TaxID=694435 RepID=A0A318S8W4_9DEIO|nr:hypothetical protein [Deinococcus yavapaiensis]PYE55487.1 hypothetical protein DES52_103322 [Deinococcus yavapaiensis KR-236]